MHARKTARDALFPSTEDDVFFAPRRGDIVFRDNVAIRAFADRVNRREGRSSDTMLRPAELGAMALLHQVLHAVIAKYRATHPDSFRRFAATLEDALGGAAHGLLVDFVATFPPPSVYRSLRGAGDDTPEKWLERVARADRRDPLAGRPAIEMELDEELLLLWVTNQNPAYDPVRTIVTDVDLGPRYRAFVAHALRFFEEEPRFGPRGESLVDLLLAPGRAHPTSIFEQLGYVEESWGRALGLDEDPLWQRFAGVQDLRAEEGKWFQRGGPGPGEPLLEAMRFRRREEEEPAQFSPDTSWMPNVVLIAKSTYVWLDQLSRKYHRPIRTLDQIPDEELDLLQSRHINGLWLIGLFERSRASQRIKQMHGHRDALASAYSLKCYEIAKDLGGMPAYENLRDRAWARGIRLAADMVPNHVGIDADWVIEHPDWFLQTSEPPFPVYRFGGPNLSDHPRIGIYLEEGYWDRSDAAVVFRRHDRWTGEDRFIYHGNDGTSIPWNDTAQLDYMNPEVRRAVIETILHVASMFPIIRFDAAMTLAKRHIQRLWFPLPGQAAGAIPSRADYAMTQEEFDRAMPNEFWREVVDIVAERAPDTLLLAEAFWMMEGYFVRTLGMHRVYNSAFMNMLKREENAKYRETIKNVLDFDPEILKRFVNFMNNPDEEPAILQFGDGDKYFGVCVLMCTMPGLPMFGHGQIEGLREKYGMEYRRAKMDEEPNPWIVARHEREIFPLLEKRWLFSGVENFALYDFVTDMGYVDEDVFAYSNGAGDQRALVVFNNRFKVTRGTIRRSTHRGTLGKELNLDEDLGAWLVIRDVPHGLEYLRMTRDIIEDGMTWELRPYQYHVLTGFRHVNATFEKPYHRLAAELAGRGVPDIELAVRELYLRPVHAPFRTAVSKGHMGWLSAQLDAEDVSAARAALEERLGHVADGLEWMLTERARREVVIDRAPALRLAGDRFAALHAFVRADAKRAAELPPAPRSSESSETILENANGETSANRAGSGATASVLHVDLLLAWIQLEAVLDLVAAGEAALEEARSRPPAYLSTTRASAIDPAAALVEHAPATETADATAPAAKDAEPAEAKDVRPAVEEAEPASAKEANEEAAQEGEPLAEAVTVKDVERAAAEEADREGVQEAEASAAKVAEPEAAEAEGEPEPPATEPEPTAAEQAEPEKAKAVEGGEEAASDASSSAASPAQAPSSSSSSDRRAEPSSETVVARAPAARVATVAPAAPTWSTREAHLAEWELVTPLVDGFSTTVAPDEARRRAALVALAATLPSGPIGPALRLALGSPRGQVYLDVHEYDGVLWLSKERFEELARFLAEREIASGRVAPDVARADAEAFARLAEREGYRAERILSKLGPPPKPDAPIRLAEDSPLG